MIEVKVPELGENIEEADVASVLVREGETIERDQSILELATDKASFELPSSHAGVVKEVHVKPGDSVSVGQVAILLEDAEPEARAKARDEPSARPAAEEPARAAGPAARRLARELGVDLNEIERGDDELITGSDVRAYAREPRRAPDPEPEPERPSPERPSPETRGDTEREPLSRLARVTAENVTRSWRTIPHVTQHDLIDVTALERARSEYQAQRTEDDPSLTMTVLAIKAAVAALKAFPRFNASLDTEASELIIKRYYNIGIAVDTEQGLLVPVVQDADRKTTRELAAAVDSLARRARVQALWPAEMNGGTFTITNLGGLGGTTFTPIIRHPEVAILGLSRLRTEKHLRDGAAVSLKLLPVSLSYDHRVVNGADAVRFVRALGASLASPLSLLIDS